LIQIDDDLFSQERQL